MLHAESLKPISPKVFPKQDCFHRYYWKSMSLHQEKHFPDKGTSAAGTALPAHLLLLYHVTELRYGDLPDTWRR